MIVNTKIPMDHELMKSYISRLKWDFSGVASFDIGRSLFGRKLTVLRIGSGTRELFVNAAHHGSEWMTAMQLLYFCNSFLEAMEDDMPLFGFDCRKIAHDCTLFLLPMVNPDGVELAINGLSPAHWFYDRLKSMNGGLDFTHWQANGRGVDLNHNYNAGFAYAKELEPSYGVTGPCASRFGGDFPESEPETSAICSFLRKNPMECALALHSQGEEIYCDYAGNIPPGGAEIANRMSELSDYKVCRPDGIAVYGGFKDWFIGTFGRPGFTVELGRGENPLPLIDFQNIFRRCATILLAFCS